MQQLTKPLFGRFGFELTYYLDIDQLPQSWKDSPWVFIDCLMEGVNAAMKNGLRGRAHKWINRAHLDGQIIEIPTPIINTYEEFWKEYPIMLKQLKQYCLTESSNVCTGADGGCHINFDLRQIWNYALKGKDSYYKDNGAKANKFVDALLINVANLFHHNPSIAWAFNTYNDKISAAHNRKWSATDYNFGKGYVINPIEHLSYWSIRANYQRWDRIELRPFMMPGDNKELHLHFDFANCLMQYCFELTKKNHKKVSVTHDYKMPLTDYNFTLASEELKDVCSKIGFDWAQIERSGKLEILGKRMNLGKDYKN